MPGFEGVWSRILQNAGDEFAQVNGQVFTYGIEGSGIRPSTTETTIAKSHFEKAWNRMPVAGPGDLQDLWGPSYLFAILSDPRMWNEPDSYAFRFKCAKCGGRWCGLSQLRASSGGLTAHYDVDDQILTLVTCKACRFSEVYQMPFQEFKDRYGLQEDEFEDTSEE